MLGTIQRGLAVHVCARMTQHKSIHVIPPKQWLKEATGGKKGRGSLSATATVEMAAGAWWMPRMTATDCLMRLAMVISITSVTLVRCCQPKLREQLQFSINEESTYQEIRDKVLSF